jgi:hypothetical protein
MLGEVLKSGSAAGGRLPSVPQLKVLERRLLAFQRGQLSESALRAEFAAAGLSGLLHEVLQRAPEDEALEELERGAAEEARDELQHPRLLRHDDVAINDPAAAAQYTLNHSTELSNRLEEGELEAEAAEMLGGQLDMTEYEKQLEAEFAEEEAEIDAEYKQQEKELVEEEKTKEAARAAAEAEAAAAPAEEEKPKGGDAGSRRPEAPRK